MSSTSENETTAEDTPVSDKKLEAEYRGYLDHRSQLNQGELEVSGRYDQWILTLSGGALGISITFMEKIAPSPAGWTLILLGFAWLSLVASIVLGLVSLLTSQSAYRREREILDENVGVETPSEKANLPAICTHRLNIAAMGAFCAGAVLLCLFSIFNLL